MTASIPFPPDPKRGARSPAEPRFLTLTESEFVERFHPVPNHLDVSAGFDFGEGGCLFDASGAQLAFVRGQPPSRLWTIVEGDEGLEITDGMHLVNRLGYLVTVRCCPTNSMVSVPLDD